MKKLLIMILFVVIFAFVLLSCKYLFIENPKNRIVVKSTSRQIDLNWDDNTEPDLSRYNIYRSKNDGIFSKISQTSVTVSEYMDVNTPNIDYSYFVTAVDTSNNESTKSNTVTVMALTETPTMTPTVTPTPFTVTAGQRYFYVDSKLGNDSNVGTKAKPWRTLDRVNRSLFDMATQPNGIQISLARSCVWRETIIVPVSGIKDSQKVVFGAYGTGQKPIVLGSDLIDSKEVETRDYCVSIQNKNYITFSNIEFKNPKISPILTGKCNFVYFESVMINDLE